MIYGQQIQYPDGYFGGLMNPLSYFAIKYQRPDLQFGLWAE